ncbi:hypothetical protein HED60_08710 [Planctomycetales bacterium ZRK34]|nr:hypothetical protein HED60_08710 [Planctomycetales bacterium ZRK34]
MIQAAFGGEPFSANVDLWLEYDGRRIPLSHVEPADVIAQQPIDLPAGAAVLVICVDDQVQRMHVMLDEGMSATRTRARMRPLDSVPF